MLICEIILQGSENESFILDDNGLSIFEEEIPSVAVQNWTSLLSDTQQRFIADIENNQPMDAIGTNIFITAINHFERAEANNL